MTGGKDIVCLEANDLTATVCRRCGALISPKRTCPTCGYANALDAGQCNNPAGCPHVFRRVDVGRVTAKPFGIRTESGAYSVIVPKGTPYPMPEPVVRSYQIATHTKRAIWLPIYHAEVGEFNPDDINQWIGAADIDLEGEQLPAEIRIDVSISVDADGCLDVVALVQDGSGRRQRAYINPNQHAAPPPPGDREEVGDEGEA